MACWGNFDSPRVKSKTECKAAQQLKELQRECWWVISEDAALSSTKDKEAIAPLQASGGTTTDPQRCVVGVHSRESNSQILSGDALIKRKSWMEIPGLNVSGCVRGRRL